MRSGSFDLPDGSLYFEIAGEGPVVTLIHRGLWDSRTWDPQVPVLVDAAFASSATTSAGTGGPAA